MAQKFPPRSSTCRKSRRRWEPGLRWRERPSPSRNAPPAEWMCARPAVGVRLTKATDASSPFPHRTSPSNLPRRDGPAVDPRSRHRKESCQAVLPVPSAPRCATERGNFRAANGYHFLQLQRRGASRQTLGAEAALEPSRGCLRAGL